MQLKDILTEDEIAKYNEEWRNFKGKYTLENSYHTHSGKPSISQVFRFNDKLLFRARVFQNRLRKMDIYYLWKTKYRIPVWHVNHFYATMEQLYHASTLMMRNTNELATRDVPLGLRLSKPISWDEDISLELILELKGKRGNFLVEHTHFTFYDDKADKERGNASQEKNHVLVYAFVSPRAYTIDIGELKKGNTKAAERLIKKIEMQNVCIRDLVEPRTNPPDKELLIKQLNQGKIPEAELHDFFSFWDKSDIGEIIVISSILFSCHILN